MPRPRRTDDELIALVHGKVDQLHLARRRRSRAVVVGATLLLLLTVAAAASVAVGSSSSSTNLHTADQPEPSTSTESTFSTASTEAGPAATDTTAPSDPEPQGPTPASPTTERPTGASTTTMERSTTTTSGQLPECVSSNFAARMTTPGTFAYGELIPITTTIENLGPACWSAPNPGNPNVFNRCVQFGAWYIPGEQVWSSLATGASCSTMALAGPVGVGWKKSRLDFWRQVQCVQEDCTMAQVPAGSYSLSVLPDHGWPGVTVQPITVVIHH